MSTEPLASSVPFPPLHTSSHLFLLTCDKKPLPERWGEGEASKAPQQWLLCWSSSGKTQLKEKPVPCQGPVSSGQLGDRCTMCGDSSHQLLQNLSSWCWGSNPPGSMQAPKENNQGSGSQQETKVEGKKNQNYIGYSTVFNGERAQVRQEKFLECCFLSVKDGIF